MRWWGRGLRGFLGIYLDIEGLELIDPSETYIIAPLHEGFADALALVELPLPQRYVARDELFQKWVRLGPLLRDTGQIEICPEQGVSSYRKLLRIAHEIIAGGESLVIFPQGTILGIESDFNLGAFALARSLKRPLLPVVLTGSHRVWEFPYTPRLRFGQHMSLKVLPPLSVEECQASTNEALRCNVQSMLKAAALSGTLAQPRRFVPARDGYWDGFAYRIDPAFPELAQDIAAHRSALIPKIDESPLPISG
jgi:1-acyl-sn-glycerol-3-phosphate acyltransferase